MFKIKVRGEFSAAHCIDGYAGDCARLHGHNWRVVAAFKNEKLDELGFAWDFKKAKTFLNEILKEFDHDLLNKKEILAGGNPTSERIAEAIYKKLKKGVPENIAVESVEVFESDSASVEFSQ